MESIASIFSAADRLAPKPFVFGAVAVYLVSFLSQFLLAAPIMARASVVPFLVVQGLVAWFWYALHARRLRDAGRPAGAAVALIVLYLLAVILLLLVTLAANSAGPAGGDSGGSLLQIFLLVFLLGAVLGEPNLGLFGMIVLAVLALVMLPVVMTLIFSIWVATRPRAP